jgi:hypothetical protein
MVWRRNQLMALLVGRELLETGFSKYGLLAFGRTNHSYPNKNTDLYRIASINNKLTKNLIV